MTYGPHIPEWIAVCDRLGMVREAVTATNCFAIDSSNALLARAWPMSGEEPRAVAHAGEQFAATKAADRHFRTLHHLAMDIGVVPFGGIYALVATFDGAIPLDLCRLFEPHKKPLLDLLAALPPVDGPGRSSRSASIRPPRA
jgi:hypothetical protein